MRDFLARLLFGGSCFVCRGASRELLCEACREELPRLGNELCPRCALPCPGGAVCGRCLAEPPAYDATIAAFAYDFPATIPSWSVDRVIPVPLSSARLRSRGYNQAAEIARQLARGKLDVDVCVRRGDSVPQTELPWDERRRNVRGAFGCRRPLAGATVAVVDDVMTTGATLDELALTLKRAGAARVVNWVVARTLPPA